MNARDTVLQRVTEAARGAADASPTRDYRRSLGPDEDVLALLIDRLEDYRASVIDLRSSTDTSTVRAAVDQALRERGVTKVVVPVDFPLPLRPASHVVEDRGLSNAELEDSGASITTSAAAVALSGTVLLDHGPGQGRRALTLIPDIHVCLVDVSRVVGTLPEAIALLGARPIMTWISGPSATSDIELVRVEGVHGPRTLVVVLHSLGAS